MGVTLFVLTAGYGRLGGHIVLAARAGLRATPAASIPLFIECVFCSGIVPSFALKEVLGRYNENSCQRRLKNQCILLSFKRMLSY